MRLSYDILFCKRFLEKILLKKCHVKKVKRLKKQIQTINRQSKISRVAKEINTKNTINKKWWPCICFDYFYAERI